MHDELAVNADVVFLDDHGQVRDIDRDVEDAEESEGELRWDGPPDGAPVHYAELVVALEVVERLCAGCLEDPATPAEISHVDGWNSGRDDVEDGRDADVVCWHKPGRILVASNDEE